MVPRGVDGSYSLPAGTLVQSGDTVLPSQHNPAMQDLGSSVGNSLSRDGLGGMRADLAMGGFDITNIADIGLTGSIYFSGVLFDPATKANVAGQVFTGTVSVKTPTVGGASVVAGTTTTSGYIAIFAASNVRMGYIGNIQSNVSGTHIQYVNENAGGHNFNGPMFIYGSEAVVRSARYNSFGVLITDGTAAPSGGNSGDLYFQYT